MKLTTILCTLFMVAVAATGAADVPQTLSYQGVLKNADGTVVRDSTYTVAFRLYDADVTELWLETDAVQVVDGIFNTTLGDSEALDLPFDETYWLGVSVGSESELTPRIELASVPYAFRAMAAESVVGGVGDSDWAESDGNVHRVSGRVGIGTASPGSKLHVYTSEAVAAHLEARSNMVAGSGLIVDWDGESDDTILKLRSVANPTYGFSDDDTKLIVTGTGEVGIGTSTPAYKLDVVGVGRFSGGLFPGTSTYFKGEKAVFLGGGGMPSGQIICSTGDDLYLQTVTAGNNIILMPDGAGRVGVGMASPSYDLDVSGSVHADTFHGDGSNLTGISGTTDNDWQIGAGVVWTDNRVGIGPDSHNPGEPLVVTGTRNGSDPLVRITNSGSGHGILVRTGDGGAGACALEGDNRHTGEGSTTGVKGITRASGVTGSSAVGLLGVAVHVGAVAGGANFGVLGRTHSWKASGSAASVPAGVFGEALADNGIAWGVDAETYSETYEAAGLKAIARHPTGSAFGALIVNESPNGTGVRINMPNDESNALYAVGKITATGSISGNVLVAFGETRSGHVSTYGVTSASPMIEDVGRATLQEGIVRVTLDARFRELVTTRDQHPLSVQVQPNGPTGQLWVELHDDGFTIHDPASSSAPVTYWVKAHRRGSESLRFEPVKPAPPVSASAGRQ